MSMTQIDIAADTFGGKAAVRDVERRGPVTFVAADYVQMEGAPEIGPAARDYYRLSQREGPDFLEFRWKDVETRSLVQRGPRADAPTGAGGPLPLTTGLWVIAGTSCDDPADAARRISDGTGLRGSASTACTITGIVNQLCTGAHDGRHSRLHGVIETQAPYRFGLTEDGENRQIDDNRCGLRLHPEPRRIPRPPRAGFLDNAQSRRLLSVEPVAQARPGYRP